jgi:hypothetical protein
MMPSTTDLKQTHARKAYFSLKKGYISDVCLYIKYISIFPFLFPLT